MDEIYEILLAKLDEIPELNWVDLEKGQLDNYEQRPAVSFPCATISIVFPTTQDLNLKRTIQDCTVQIGIRVSQDFSGDTSLATPKVTRDKSLGYMRLVKKVYEKLQGFSDNSFNPLTRTSQREEQRNDNIKVVQINFSSEFTEYVNPQKINVNGEVALMRLRGDDGALDVEITLLEVNGTEGQISFSASDAIPTIGSSNVVIAGTQGALSFISNDAALSIGGEPIAINATEAQISFNAADATLSVGGEPVTVAGTEAAINFTAQNGAVIAEDISSSLSKITNNSTSNGSTNNPMGYVEYLPEGYNNQSDWPVIVWYHGAGEPGPGTNASLDSILNTTIANWLKTNDIPFVVLCPQDDATSGNFTSQGMENFYEWARIKYGAKTDAGKWNIQALSASGLGLRQWIESNKPSLATLNTITASASTIASTGSVGDWNNLIPLQTKVWFHNQVGDATVSIGGQRGFYRQLVEANGGQDWEKYRLTAYDESGHSCWTYLYSGLGTSKPQLSGRVNPPNTALVGDYYVWTNPETWFSWMQLELNSISINGTEASMAFGADDATLLVQGEPLTVSGTEATLSFTADDATTTASSAGGIAWESKLDFSLSNAAFDSSWNAINGSPHDLDQQSGGSPIGILDTNQVDQGVSLYVLGNESQGVWSQLSGFGSASNDAGTETGNNSGIYPDAVMAGYWYHTTGTFPDTRVRFEGLDPAKTYNLYFFGSRESSTGRITTYTINGSTKSLTASANTSNEIEFLNIAPDVNGHITITLAESGADNYAYLNAARIQENN